MRSSLNFLTIPLLWCAIAGIRLWGAAPSAPELTREIRGSGLDPVECYRVRDLRFNKDGVKLFFNDGYLIFSKPLLGERLAAVFTTEVEGGDGEVILIPPSRAERASLAAFTQSPNLDEHLNAALMVFTEGSGALLLEQVRKSEASKKTPEMGPVLARQWDAVLQNVIGPMQMRVIEDVLAAPGARQGVAFFALSGRTLSTFDVLCDERQERRVEVRQRVTRDGKDVVNVWTSFVPRGVQRTGGERAAGNTFQPLSYRMEVEISPEMAVKVNTKLRLRVGDHATRTFAFRIASAMNLDAVKLDGSPVDVVGEAAARIRPANGGSENEFLVVAAEPIKAGSEHEVEFEHHGNVIATRGDGVYFVNARDSWYPHTGGGYATYDLNFRFPKRLTLVAAGAQLEDRVEGDVRITRRQTTVPIGSAGFNLGVYQKVNGTAAGISYEVFGNRNLEEALRPVVVDPAFVPPRQGPRQNPRTPSMPPTVTPYQPDPVGRLRAVAGDLASSLEFFEGLFGAPILKTLTVAPIPGTFGQGFPGLVYLSTFAYLDPVERPLVLRTAREQVFFSDLLVPHEAAHQWWGGVVAADRREDYWLVEALANYSALLWLEKKKGFKEVEKVLNGYRDELLAKTENGEVVDSAGPVVWGARLEASPVPAAWRVITYDKGTWVIHMLRRRVGDEAFFRILRELRRRYEAKPITTAEFAALVRELRPASVSANSIDTFFETWVYQTGIPGLKVRFNLKGAPPALRLDGVLEQTGAADDFSADIPVEVQFAKGPPETIWVRASGEQKTFSATLRQTPAKVVIPNDVLMKR